MLRLLSTLLVCPLCLALAPYYPPTLGGDEVPRPSEAAPQGDPAEKLQMQPIPFLEKCLAKYDESVKGYTLTFRKRERIGGTLYPLEVIDVAFRDKPHSVLFVWKQGQRKAAAALYVEGENNGKMLARPAGKLAAALAGIVERDLDSPDAKQSGRYGLNEFGLKKGLSRILTAWKKADESKTLFVEYLGEKKVPETGDRLCHVFHRGKYAQPEDDGVTDLTLYIDAETLLMNGTVLKGDKGAIIGEYFFQDIRINPTFAPEQFTRAALARK